MASMGKIYGARYSPLAAQETFVVAALLAAHATSEDGTFRPSEVRFFFLLFTNWGEHDVLHPRQDLALTQVRRVLEDMRDDGRACLEGPPRRWRCRFTDEGVDALVVALVEPSAALPPRPLETSLFVLTFASLYRPVLVRRLRLDTRPTPLQRRLGRLLDPRRIRRRAQRRARDLLADLDARIADGEAMQAALDAAPAEDDDARRHAITAFGSYQLERVRPVEEVLASLPEDVRRVELDRGPGVRARLLFAPLAAVVRRELEVLDALDLG